MRRIAVTFGTEHKARPYQEALRTVGLDPVLVPASGPVRLNGFGGLLLTGGADVDPALYGQEAHSETQTPSRERDATESALLAEAIRVDLPVLAICRGLQLLNVHLGGTLYQHLPEVKPDGLRHKAGDQQLEVHPVTIEMRSQLAVALGVTGLVVNSRHHQAADEVPSALAVTARAADGIVEGLEHRERSFVVAVQWHPEDRWTKFVPDRRLFEAFAAAVNGQRTAV